MGEKLIFPAKDGLVWDSDEANSWMDFYLLTIL